MKHPKYRVRDIIVLHPDAKKELLDFALSVVEVLPKGYGEIRPELCGSLAFGCSSLASDIDLNFAAIDYNTQIPLKREYLLGKSKAEVNRMVLDFFKKTGLQVDVGITDPMGEKYNVVCDLKSGLLYNRGRSLFPDSLPGPGLEDPMKTLDPDLKPINIHTFDWRSTPLPPVFVQHLQFSTYLYLFMPKPRVFPRKSEWLEDEWAAEVPYWREYYGDQFLEYQKVDGKLIPV